MRIGMIRFGLCLVVSLATGCKGDAFSAATSQDAGANAEQKDPAPAPTKVTPTRPKPTSGPCADVECEVPDCPPQLQYTPLGECCPVCVAPRVCEQGARCSALTCPGSMNELSDGCCECEDVQCSGDALPCSDPQCVGAEQEMLGDGCCLCGEQLQCADDQRPCDAILCDGDVLYEGDGCCRCREVTCGAGSTLCDELECEADKLLVGGGCCECAEETPSQCPDGSVACADLECEGQPDEVTPGCCQCRAGECDPNLGQFECSGANCPGDVTELPNGCCMCDESATCPSGSAACSSLQCPGAEPVDLGDGCCNCSTCPVGTVSCAAIECAGQVETVEDGCCQCSAAAVCDDELQGAYDDARAALLEDLGDPACNGDSDCVSVPLETRCRVECDVALHRDVAEELVAELTAWAAKQCDSCPQVDLTCDSSAREEASVGCVGGVCKRLATP